MSPDTQMDSKLDNMRQTNKQTAEMFIGKCCNVVYMDRWIGVGKFQMGLDDLGGYKSV
jgi:hypothetical protein